MDLLLLAPEIQEELLFGEAGVPLRELIPLVRSVAWNEQRAARCLKTATQEPLPQHDRHKGLATDEVQGRPQAKQNFSSYSSFFHSAHAG